MQFSIFEMKNLTLKILILTLTASAWAADLPENLDEADPFGAKPTRSQDRKELKVEMMDTKTKKKLADIQLSDANNGVLLLFETRFLPKKRFSLTLENSCSRRSEKAAEEAIKEKSIRRINIQGYFYSDEFRLKGYTLEHKGQKFLEGKVLKLYQVSRSSAPEQIGCVPIHLQASVDP